MRLFFAIFCILPFVSFGAVRGWLVRVTLSCYRVSINGYSSSTGAPMYSGAYTAAKKYVWKYQAGSATPSYQSLGLQQYRDLQGNPIPSAPFHSEFDYYVVTAISSYSVDDTRFPDSRDLFIPSYDTSVPWMSPIYDSSNGSIYTAEGVSITGVNSSFGSGGSLDILQGRVSMGDNGGDVPMYLYYGSDGSPTFSASDNGGYEYQYDENTGKYLPVLVGGSSGGSGSSVDLSPVVTAIESQGGLTRSQLVDLLGASGNSWVYDCKLSLGQLYDLASTQGLLSSSDSQRLEYIDVNLSTIVPSVLDIASKDFSPTINVAAPNVTVNPAEVNIDLSGVRSDLSSILSKVTDVPYALTTRLSTMQLYQKELPNIRSRLDSIKTILENWNNTQSPVIPSPSGYEVTDENDGLPDGLKSFYADGSPTSVGSTVQRLGDYVAWGDSGAPRVFNLDFLSGFLTSIIGSVPSVGSDPVMFDFDLEIPYLGHIQRRYSWADFPYIGDFRSFLVWVLYLLFGLACFKLLHKTLI